MAVLYLNISKSLEHINKQLSDLARLGNEEHSVYIQFNFNARNPVSTPCASIHWPEQLSQVVLENAYALPTQDWVSILKCLPSQVRSLQLGFNDLGTRSEADLIEIFSTIPATVLTLNLEYNCLNQVAPKCWRQLMDLLRGVKTLDLTCNALDLSHLTFWPSSLKKLILNKNNLSQMNVSEVAQLFYSLPELNSLEMQNCGLFSFFHALASLPKTLRSFNVQSGELHSITQEQWINFLKELPPELTHLNVAFEESFYLFFDGTALCSPLAKAGSFFSLLDHLAHLDLSNHSIGVFKDEELISLFAAFPHTLKTLILDNNRLHLKNAKLLIEAFQSLECLLIELSLTNNHLGARNDLFAAFPSTLKKVHLHHNELWTQGWGELGLTMQALTQHVEIAGLDEEDVPPLSSNEETYENNPIVFYSELYPNLRAALANIPLFPPPLGPLIKRALSHFAQESHSRRVTLVNLLCYYNKVARVTRQFEAALLDHPNWVTSVLFILRQLIYHREKKFLTPSIVEKMTVLLGDELNHCLYDDNEIEKNAFNSNLFKILAFLYHEHPERSKVINHLHLLEQQLIKINTQNAVQHQINVAVLDAYVPQLLTLIDTAAVDALIWCQELSTQTFLPLEEMLNNLRQLPSSFVTLIQRVLLLYTHESFLRKTKLVNLLYYYERVAGVHSQFEAALLTHSNWVTSILFTLRQLIYHREKRFLIPSITEKVCSLVGDELNHCLYDDNEIEKNAFISNLFKILAFLCHEHPERSKVINHLHLLEQRLIKINNQHAVQHQINLDALETYLPQLMMLIDIAAVDALIWCRELCAQTCLPLERMLKNLQQLPSSLIELLQDIFKVHCKELSKNMPQLSDLINSMAGTISSAPYQDFADVESKIKHIVAENNTSFREIYAAISYYFVQISLSLKPEAILSLTSQRLPLPFLTSLAQAKLNDLYHPIYLEMISRDALNLGSIDDLCHNLNQKLTLGIQIAQHNAEICRLLQLAGIKAGYPKPIDFRVNLNNDNTPDLLVAVDVLLVLLSNTQLSISMMRDQLADKQYERAERILTHYKEIIKLLGSVDHSCFEHLRPTGRRDLNGQQTLEDRSKLYLNLELFLKLADKIIKNLKAIIHNLEKESVLSDPLTTLYSHLEEQLVHIRELSPNAQSLHSNPMMNHFRVQLWDKNHPHTLFLGNYVGCCLASGSSMFQAMVLRRMDDAVQFCVVTETISNKPIACLWLYFACDESNAIYLVMNFSEVHIKYALDAKLRNALLTSMLHFLLRYQQENGFHQILLNSPGYGANKDDFSSFAQIVKTPPHFDKLGGAFIPKNSNLNTESPPKSAQTYHLGSLNNSFFRKCTAPDLDKTSLSCIEPIEEVAEHYLGQLLSKILSGISEQQAKDFRSKIKYQGLIDPVWDLMNAQAERYLRVLFTPYCSEEELLDKIKTLRYRVQRVAGMRPQSVYFPYIESCPEKRFNYFKPGKFLDKEAGPQQPYRIRF